MDKRVRYVSFLLGLWVIYLLVNHGPVQRYAEMAHDVAVYHGFHVGQHIGWLLTWAVSLLVASALAVIYGGNIFGYLSSKRQAWASKPETSVTEVLEQARLARLEQLQTQLESTGEAQKQAQEAADTWKPAQEAGRQQGEGCNPVRLNGRSTLPLEDTVQEAFTTDSMAPSNESEQTIVSQPTALSAAAIANSTAYPGTQRQWLERMQAALDAAAGVATELPSSTGEASHAVWGQEGRSSLSDAEQQRKHEEWLQRVQASSDSTAAQLREQTKQQRLQALQAEIERRKELKELRDGEFRRMEEREKQEAARRAEEELQLARDYEQAQLQLLQERELREEQDREYQESLEQDRQLAAKWAAEAAAQEAERQQRQAKEREKHSQMLQLKKLKQELKSGLKEEPAAGSAEIVSVRVRLPHGSSHVRRFQSTTCLQEVKDWVQSLDDFPEWQPQKWQLLNSYPKVALDGAAELSSITQGCTQISLFVENLQAFSPTQDE